MADPPPAGFKPGVGPSGGRGLYPSHQLPGGATYPTFGPDKTQPPFGPPQGPPSFGPPSFGPPQGPPSFGPPQGPPSFGPPQGPPMFGPPKPPQKSPLGGPIFGPSIPPTRGPTFGPPASGPNFIPPPGRPRLGPSIGPAYDPSNPHLLSYPSQPPPSRFGQPQICPARANTNPKSKFGVTWVSSRVDLGVPPTAVRGGTDQDGTAIYVGRAWHEGDLIPAKVIPEKNISYVCYGGQEIMKYEFEVMCQGSLSWQFSSGGTVPVNAVPVGNTSDGETLYCGRVCHEGSWTVGKIHCSHGHCYIPFNGAEVPYSEYEVLCMD